jgi:hypothetical protein
VGGDEERECMCGGDAVVSPSPGTSQIIGTALEPFESLFEAILAEHSMGRFEDVEQVV